MEVLQFARELRRMCKSHENCCNCDVYRKYNTCSVCDLEKILPIVEEWSKTHKIKTNLDHVTEKLQEAGYTVDVRSLRNSCPAHKSNRFALGVCTSPEADCAACRNWWDEEYVEVQK